MKKWYQSKTFWFNIITVLIGVIQTVSNTFPIPQEILAVIVGGGNVILRMITTGGIEKSVI